MKPLSSKMHATKPVPQTLGMLAEKTGTQVVGEANLMITGVGGIETSQAGDITYINDKKYDKLLQTSHASAIIVSEDRFDSEKPLLISKDPRLTFAQIIHLIYPFQTLKSGIHPSSVIGKNCKIDPSVYIGPNCVIEDNVSIGQDAVLIANCYIGQGCQIGERTTLYAKAVVYHGCYIGDDCVIHSGAIIGSDGFGFVKQKERWVKVPQIGGVVIKNRCEIGANTTIDRGAINHTEIEDDVILDNLIQIGHNVKIGQGTAIAACTGVAGSTVIGKNCMIGGRTGIVGHIQITDNVHIVASSNVGQSVTQPGVYGSGLTITDMRTWKRNLVRFHQLDNLATRLFELERKLKSQEEIK